MASIDKAHRKAVGGSQGEVDPVVGLIDEDVAERNTRLRPRHPLRRDVHDDVSHT